MISIYWITGERGIKWINLKMLKVPMAVPGSTGIKFIDCKNLGSWKHEEPNSFHRSNYFVPNSGQSRSARSRLTGANKASIV